MKAKKETGVERQRLNKMREPQMGFRCTLILHNKASQGTNLLYSIVDTIQSGGRSLYACAFKQGKSVSKCETIACTFKQDLIVHWNLLMTVMDIKGIQI